MFPPATEAEERVLKDADQRVYLRGLTWDDLEQILAMRGDTAGPRLTYLDGTLELMSPSSSHERIKTTIGRILEAYAMRLGLVLEGYGSWTIKRKRRKRAVEPDECYVLGPLGDRKRPDLAIEVVWTSGGLDKLDVYRGIGVAEVWFWKRDNSLEVHVLREAAYERVPRSVLLPELDLALVARCIAEAQTQTEAVQRFLAALE